MKSLPYRLRELFTRADSGIFRQIPLDIPGKLYTSPMPYGAYDPGNRLIKIYQRNNIQHVFALVTDAELEKKTKRNIFKEYDKYGITYSRYIIKDFEAPSIDVIKELVTDGLKRLQNRQRVLVHCHAGVGRTAVAVTCLTIAIKNISAKEAIAHIKQNMMVNITSEQIRLIETYEKKMSETNS